MPDDFETMWHAIAPVGRHASSGGYRRQPWTSSELELRAWFREQAAARGLEVEQDVYGNTIAWWRPEVVAPEVLAPDPAERGPELQVQRGTGAVLTGSHLDSVVDGGAFDGPLGVVSALAAFDELRARGLRPRRPLGIGVFVEEEGSRFGLPCLGSRLATGAVTWDDVRELRDPDSIALADVQQGGAPSPLLHGVTVFVELHVEQGRGLVDRGAPVGAASGIWPHGRWRFDFTGRADHAGTTRMEDRADPMLGYATTALAAHKQAGLAGQRATFGRVEVAPGSTNTIPSRVTAWLDARAESDDALVALVEAVEGQAGQRTGRDGIRLAVTPESVSAAVAFDADLTGAVAGDLPLLPTQAGHDAGVLQAAGIPSAMLFVRNPTGVSHAPGEHAETGDCLAGVVALADALERLLT